jgi:hypothetical protein
LIFENHSWCKRWPRDLTSQDCQLLAQHNNLEFLARSGSEQKADKLQNALNRDAANRQEHDASEHQAKSAVILRRSS